MELPLRLLAVASLIPSTKTVVDVGSDHGKLGAYCLQNEVCEKVIATDIHKQPAERTSAFLRLSGFEDKSSVLCTDGLHGVPYEDDMCIVIAGMGGLEIMKILKDACTDDNEAWKKWTWVLQPQRSEYELREFLCDNGFEIKEEKIVFDRDHCYTIEKAQYTGRSTRPSDAALFLGPYILEKKPEGFPEYMDLKKKVMKKRALGDPRCAKILDSWEALL